jgi:hypothetical protein
VRAEIRRATTKDVDARFPDANTLLAALESAARGDPPAPTGGRVRTAVLLGMAGAAAASVIAAVTVAVLTQVDPSPAPEPTVVELDAEVVPPQAGHLTVRGPPGAYVRAAGASGVLGDDGALRLEDVPGGAQPVTYAIGEGCEPCLDDGDCSEACGVGELSVDVAPGGEVEVDLPEVPSVKVSLVAPQLSKGRGGVFKKKDWPIRATLGERTLTVRGPGAASGSVRPGVHTLQVDVGTCSPEERGCLPDGCSPKCSSLRRTITVPWTGPLTISLDDLPPPQR